jgi:6-phosphogluconolactonase (cycloisomerase 2 family)
LLVASICTLAACHSSSGGGNNNPPPPPPQTFSVGGTVTGLDADAAGLVLQNNGGPDLAISTNGSFAFPAQLATGAAYSVTIKTQPNIGPLQLCAVTNGSGTVANAAVTNIAVACVSRVFKFLYVTSPNANELRGYAINALDGRLSELAVPPIQTPPGPVTPIPDPSGKFMFLASRGDSFSVPPQLSVYVANNVTGALAEIADSPYDLATTPLVAGALNVLTFIHPSGAFGHVSLPTSPSSFYGATINPTTGQLTQIPGTPIEMGFGSAITMTYDSTGGFAFVPTASSSGQNSPGEIRSFLVNVPSGVLTPIGSFSTSGNSPVGAFLTPGGDYLLTTNVSSGTFMVFAVNKTAGTLTPISAPIATGPAGVRPIGPVYNRRNNVFYMTNTAPGGPASVATFRLDLATGFVSPVGAPVSTNGAGGSVQLHPSGRFLYQYNRFSATPSIQRFTLDPITGQPTLQSDTTLLPGAANVAMIPDVSGKFLYVTDQNAATISSYSIDATTGALTLINSLPASFGALFTLPFLLQ